MRETYGLNQPRWKRYLIWMGQLGMGNMGRSLISGAPVRDEIFARLPATLQLTATSLLFGIVFGAGLGILSAVKQYTWIDQALTLLGFIWISTPGFVFAISAIFLFSLKISLFPTSGITNYGEEASMLTRLHHMVFAGAGFGIGKHGRLHALFTQQPA